MATFIDNHEIYERDDYKNIIQSNNDNIIIMKFTADWCKPCQLLTPILKKYIPILHSAITFYEINVDDSFDIYAYLKSKKVINGIPALYVYKKGDNPLAPSKSFIGADSVIKHFVDYMEQLKLELPPDDNKFNCYLKLKKEASTKEASTKEASTKEASTKEASTKEASTEETSTEEASTEETSTEEAGTEEASTEEASTEEAGKKEASTEETSTEEAQKKPYRRSWYRRSWYRRSWYRRSWYRRSWYRRSWYRRSW